MLPRRRGSARCSAMVSECAAFVQSVWGIFGVQTMQTGGVAIIMRGKREGQHLSPLCALRPHVPLKKWCLGSEVSQEKREKWCNGWWGVVVVGEKRDPFVLCKRLSISTTFRAWRDCVLASLTMSTFLIHFRTLLPPLLMAPKPIASLHGCSMPEVSLCRPSLALVIHSHQLLLSGSNTGG